MVHFRLDDAVEVDEGASEGAVDEVVMLRVYGGAPCASSLEEGYQSLVLGFRARAEEDDDEAAAALFGCRTWYAYPPSGPPAAATGAVVVVVVA